MGPTLEKAVAAASTPLAKVTAAIGDGAGTWLPSAVVSQGFLASRCISQGEGWNRALYAIDESDDVIIVLLFRN